MVVQPIHNFVDGLTGEGLSEIHCTYIHTSELLYM